MVREAGCDMVQYVVLRRVVTGHFLEVLGDQKSSLKQN
jgi:hypothetical protein